MKEEWRKESGVTYDMHLDKFQSGCTGGVDKDILLVDTPVLRLSKGLTTVGVSPWSWISAIKYRLRPLEFLPGTLVRNSH